MKNRLFYIICALLFTTSVQGQVSKVYEIEAYSGDTIVMLDKLASSFVLSSNNQEAVIGTHVFIGAEFLSGQLDLDLSYENDYWSQLHILSDSSRSITVNNTSSNIVFLHVLHVEPKAISVLSNNSLKADNCDQPQVISQFIWRDGLTTPDYERIFTDTEHIIVHHSAGSNTDSDYTNVVRNIYVYHTEIRGWSDIGYNYLIAQDGTIYAGRDPGVYPQDKVQGAHFSGSNAHTMGICVLGNYEDVTVPQVTLESLIDLITWKCAQDSLNPFGIGSHPLNSALPIIAGHQEGGATLCPGENLFNELPYIKGEVAGNLRECGYDIPSALSNIDITEIEPTGLYDFFTLSGVYIKTSLFSEFNQQGCFLLFNNNKQIYQTIIIE